MTFGYWDDPILGPALSHWILKRGTASMPLKRDLDPTEIPPRLLPHLQLIDVVGDGARFRYRLIGTSLVDTYGKDYTGSYVDELVSGDRLTFIDQTYRTVCQLKAPVFSHNHYRTIRDTDLIANRMYLPLTKDGIEVHYILGALQFEYADSIHGGVWGLATLEPSEQYIEPVDLEARRSP